MLKIKIVKTRIPKYCFCPHCGIKQPFKKENEHWKIVKDFSLNKPVLLNVQIVSAKCLNPDCKTKSFCLPVKGITKFQRATNRVIIEAITSNIIMLIEFNPKNNELLTTRWNKRNKQVF